MACATLKRSMEFDPLHSPAQRSPKRRRCMPMTMSPTVPPTKAHQVALSPFRDVAPKLSAEQIKTNLTLEMKRLQRRRQLPYSTPSSSPPPQGCSATPAECGTKPHGFSTSPTFFNTLSPSKETPLFTFKQVSLVCERMMKEREDQMREEYDKVLTCKLAEQYEAFLKFNHDQLHRRFRESAASYVS